MRARAVLAAGSRFRRVLLAASVLLAIAGSGGPPAIADTATYDDVPGSEESARIWSEITQGIDLPDVQIRGGIGRDALASVAGHLKNVPLAVVERADAVPTRSLLFAGRLTDLPGFEYLRGVKPTGWPDGYTWDTVAGAGAGAPGGGMVVNPNSETTRVGEGAWSLSLHEYGHVLDRVHATSPQALLSESADWRNGPFAELTRVGAKGWFATNPAYFLGNPAEWWAESFDLYTASPEQHEFMRVTYPQTWQFLRDKLGTPRFEVELSIAPQPVAKPKVSGRARVGRSLRCAPGLFVGATTIKTRWLRDGKPITRATRTNYRLTRRDRGRRIACQSTAVNAAGTSTAVSRAVRISR